jgi:hypothetical protein
MLPLPQLLLGPAFRAMLGLLKRLRGHRAASTRISSQSKGKVVIIEHPAVDYKPSNPK